MKNRWVRRTLIVLLTIAFAFGGLLAYALYKAQQRMDRRIEITPYDVAIPGDAAALERGKYLFSTRGCVDCHGADGAGRAFVDDGSMRIKGPNISPGPGNVVARYSPADWERVLRHGVKPDGRPLMIMPSEDYNRLSDADLGALVAYVKQLPPVAGGAADLRLPLPYRALYGLGKIPDAASIIDHTRKPAAPVAEAVSVAHGEYVSAMCIGCHGEGLSGGKIPTGPPDWPAAPNLTPGEGSVMPRYPTAQSLMAMLRQGRRPDATVIAVMPFESFKNISDTDVAALHLYLKSLPPRPAGGR
jgi:mono/diheme cytochrome c family protein